MLTRIDPILKNLSSSEDYLRRFQVARPREDAEELLSYLLGCGRAELYLSEKRLATALEKKFRQLVIRRSQGVPLQYLLGRAFFYGEEFKVGPGVFIPRPETEVLVEKVMALAKNCSSLLTIADIGTGSGNIAICLKKSIANCKIWAVDISQSALALAQVNAACHRADIEFHKSSLFSALGGKKFDIIVSSPPYLKSGELHNLPVEVGFEPREALDGGEDGLYYIRSLIAESQRFLKKGGHLVLEMREGQSSAAKRLLLAAGSWQKIEVTRDLNGVERVISAQIWIN